MRLVNNAEIMGEQLAKGFIGLRGFGLAPKAEPKEDIYAPNPDDGSGTHLDRGGCKREKPRNLYMGTERTCRFGEEGNQSKTDKIIVVFPPISVTINGEWTCRELNPEPWVYKTLVPPGRPYHTRHVGKIRSRTNVPGLFLHCYYRFGFLIILPSPLVRNYKTKKAIIKVQNPHVRISADLKKGFVSFNYRLIANTRCR